MLTAPVKNEIKRIVGRDNVSFSKEDLLCYSYDATNRLFLPDGVVFPRGAEEVSLILKMANSEGFGVVPRGAGSGFTGGSLPVRGGVVVSTEQMNRIIEIDTENLVAVVEPGVVTGELQKRVEDEGLFYPPDPTSLNFSTIGGNIAECAGGPRALKYGVTRDYVLGLEVVLPTGEVTEVGVRTMKGVVGYDLTRLFVGSEGTLAFVTRAYLKLLPLPETTKTMLAVFQDMNLAARTVAEIIRARIIPSTLEFIDSVCMRCVKDHTGDGLPDADAVLLIEVDGDRDRVEREMDTIKRICSGNGAVEVKVAGDRREVKLIWRARRAISPALLKVKPHKINEDVVVPRSRIPDLIRGVHEIARKRDITIACFGHAGDGNIHVNIMVDRNDPREDRMGRSAIKDVFELAVALGGTISGEHGVGITKAGYLDMELSSVSMDAMRRIKRALDPKGVLNPGKIFTEEREGNGQGA